MTKAELAGSLSYDNFAEGLVACGKYESLGEVWEHCVACTRCEHREACTLLVTEYPRIRCCQVINFLLGVQKLEEIIKEMS